MENKNHSLQTVRPATITDAPAIARLARELLDYEHELNEMMGVLTPWAANQSELIKQMMRPNTLFFVAEKYGEINGYLKVQVHGRRLNRNELGTSRWLLDLLERAGQRAVNIALRRPRPNVEATGGYIAGVFVRPELRRSNIGRLLVSAAEEWLRLQRIDSCELHVLTSNEIAMKFWKDIGYEPLALGMRKKID
ncbi:MAG: N-acetyltransferase family protein [Blastocatellia bacterium]